MQIEGVPDGYELVAIRQPVIGEIYVSAADGEAIRCDSGCSYIRPILRKLEPVTVRLKPGIYTMDKDGTVTRFPIGSDPNASGVMWDSGPPAAVVQTFSSDTADQVFEFSSPDWTKCRVEVK